MRLGEGQRLAVHLAHRQAQEVRRQDGDVLLARAQRRHLDGEHVDAVVEVLAEAPRLHVAPEIAVGGSNDAHVHLAGVLLADALVAALLQNAQQLALQLHRDVAHLVQEHRAAIGSLEAPGAIAQCAGEGTLHVPEELALVELLGYGGAVDPDHGLVRTQATLVDLPGHQLLAGAGLAQDEDAGLGGRHQLDLSIHVADGRAGADDGAVRLDLAHLLTQVLVLELQLLVQALDLLEVACVGDGCGSVIGDHAQPEQALFVHGAAAEERQHSEDLPLMQQRLAAEPPDPLALRPLRPRDAGGIPRDIAHRHRIARGRHAPHLAHPQRHAAEVAIDA